MSYFKHAFSMAILALMAGTALANVYFKGKPVHGGTTANCPVDVMRLMWGNDDMNTGDRIQGQIQVSKIVEEVNSIKIIIQGIDSAGEIVESYALSLSRHEYSGSSRYPFKGVVFLRYERGYIDRELENAWFYFDFPKKPEIKNFLVVNMVLNEREVPCNLRLVNNKLPRTLATLPRIKLGGQGDFSATTEWLPPPTPTAESELVKKPNKTKNTRSEANEAKPSLDTNVDEIAGATIYSAPVNWGISMNGATFTFVPSVVVAEGKTPRMSVVLGGSTTVSAGYSLKLEKILFFDPETKKRALMDSHGIENWPSLHLGSSRKEGKIDFPAECVKFLSEATAIKCRFSFGSSSLPEARNYDFAFSRAQVAALRELAQKCLEE